MMNDLALYNQRRMPFVAVCLIVILSTEMWSSTLIPPAIFRVGEIVSIAFLLIIFLKYRGYISKLKLPYWGYIKILLGTTLILSSLGALLFHRQEIYYSLWWQRTHLLWLFYPILHLFNLPPAKLVKMMLALGVIWCSINIVQQITYPTYYFSSRLDTVDSDFYRAGVYRFMPRQIHYGLFLGFFAYQKFLDIKRGKFLLWVAIALLGLYFYGTRQFIGGFIVSVSIFTLMQRGSTKAVGGSILILLAAVVFFYQELILGNLIEITNDQFTNKEYIRILELKFYLFENWPSWISVITGNGLAYEDSAYGKEAAYIKDTLMYYSSDVGIIGSLNNFGIIYATAALLILIKIVRTKLRNKANRYLSMFGLNALVLVLFTEYFMDVGSIPFWCILLYLIDRDQIDGDCLSPAHQKDTLEPTN